MRPSCTKPSFALCLQVQQLVSTDATTAPKGRVRDAAIGLALPGRAVGMRRRARSYAPVRLSVALVGHRRAITSAFVSVHSRAAKIACAMVMTLSECVSMIAEVRSTMD